MGKNKQILIRNVKEKLVPYCCILLGTIIAAYLLGKTLPSFILVFLLCLILISLAYYLLIHSILVKTAKEPVTKSARMLAMEVNKLSREEAKAKTEQLLQNGNKFICKKATAPLPAQIESYGEGLTEIFKKYELIKFSGGAITLGWADLGMSDLNPHYTRIGRDCEFFTEFVVRDKEETLYEIDGSEKSFAEIEKNKYTTIYHFIVYLGTPMTVDT